MYTFKNNLKTTLHNKLLGDATTIDCKQLVSSGDAGVRLAAWPTVGNGNFFTLTIINQNTRAFEIVKCTEVLNNYSSFMSFAVERGQEGTAAQDFDIAITSVEHRLTAAGLSSMSQRMPFIIRDASGKTLSASSTGFTGNGATASANSTDLSAQGYTNYTSIGLAATPNTQGVAIGARAANYASSGTAVGYNACTTSSDTVAVGVNASVSASGDQGVSIGGDSQVTHAGSVALGGQTNTSKSYQVSIAALNAATHLSSLPRLISGVASPKVAQDAANKDYVDSRITESLGTGTDVTVNQKLITDLFTGTIKASDVYQGPYGIQYDNTSDSYVRIGAPGYTAIQSMMKRCVLNANGSVNYYLHKNNSNFKEDGTLANLTGADGEVMVQIPKVYSKVTQVGTITTIMFSLTPEEGYVVDPAFVRGGVEVPYRYFHAYRGIVVSGVLRSRSGVTPTRSTTLPAFRTAARAVSTGWGITDWYLLNLVRRLCVVEFNDYIVTKYLGVGNHSGENYGRVTGVSNALGNNSSTPANDANDFMSYRGIEDFYADSWLCIDGVNVQGWQYFVNTSNDPNTFASDTFTGAYVATGVSVPSASNAFIKTCHESLQNGFIPTALGGSATTYFGDALWSAGGNQVLYFGGNANNGASCGASCVYVSSASSNSHVNIGAALCR